MGHSPPKNVPQPAKMPIRTGHLALCVLALLTDEGLRHSQPKATINPIARRPIRNRTAKTPEDEEDAASVPHPKADASRRPYLSRSSSSRFFWSNSSWVTNPRSLMSARRLSAVSSSSADMPPPPVGRSC